MRGRSKVLSSFMAVALAVGLMPLPAFAADEDDAAAGGLMAGQVDFGDAVTVEAEPQANQEDAATDGTLTTQVTVEDRAADTEVSQEGMEPQAEEKMLDPQATVNHGALTFGKAYTELNKNDDYHRYTFSLSKASELLVTGHSIIVDGTSTWSYDGMSFKIYTASGKSVYSKRSGFDSAGKTTMAAVVYLNAGSYIFEVESHCSYLAFGSKCYCPFDFKVTSTKTNVSFEEKQGGSNQTKATANTIKLGGTYKGQLSVDEELSSGGMANYYKFTVPSTRYMKFVIKGPADSGFNISVDSNTRTGIGYANYKPDSTKEYTITMTGTLSAGQYYISIKPWIGIHSYGSPADPGTKYTLAMNTEIPKQPMYRMFNPKTGEHFYTASAAERDYLQRDPKGKWNYEGVHWSVPATSSRPVYRLCNPVTGDHHYTMDKNERNHVLKVLKWRDEGIGWYSEEPSKGTRIMRLNNPKLPAGAHHYTTSAAEKRQCLKQGWKDEGYSWYVCK